MYTFTLLTGVAHGIVWIGFGCYTPSNAVWYALNTVPFTLVYRTADLSLLYLSCEKEQIYISAVRYTFLNGIV